MSFNHNCVFTGHINHGKSQRLESNLVPAPMVLSQEFLQTQTDVTIYFGCVVLAYFGQNTISGEKGAFPLLACNT